MMKRNFGSFMLFLFMVLLFSCSTVAEGFRFCSLGHKLKRASIRSKADGDLSSLISSDNKLDKQWSSNSSSVGNGKKKRQSAIDKVSDRIDKLVAELIGERQDVELRDCMVDSVEMLKLYILPLKLMTGNYSEELKNCTSKKLFTLLLHPSTEESCDLKNEAKQFFAEAGISCQPLKTVLEIVEKEPTMIYPITPKKRNYRNLMDNCVKAKDFETLLRCLSTFSDYYDSKEDLKLFLNEFVEASHSVTRYRYMIPKT